MTKRVDPLLKAKEFAYSGKSSNTPSRPMHRRVAGLERAVNDTIGRALVNLAYTQGEGDDLDDLPDDEAENFNQTVFVRGQAGQPSIPYHSQQTADDRTVWVPSANPGQLTFVNEGYIGGDGTSAPGDLNNPEGVASVEINGYPYLLVGDTGNNRIQIFGGVRGEGSISESAFGGPASDAYWDSRDFPDFPDPQVGIIGTSAGTRNGFRVFNRDTGVYDVSVNASGSGNGQFSTAWGISRGSGGPSAWLVTDFGNNRYQVFNSTGVYQSQVSTVDGIALSGPRGIAMTSDGMHAIVDSGNGRIAVEGTDRSIGEKGSGPGKFMDPMDLCFNPWFIGGNLMYVTDAGRNIVSVWNYETGTYLGEFGSGVMQSVHGIEVYRDFIYVADPVADKVWIWRVFGGPVGQTTVISTDGFSPTEEVTVISRNARVIDFLSPDFVTSELPDEQVNVSLGPRSGLRLIFEDSFSVDSSVLVSDVFGLATDVDRFLIHIEITDASAAVTVFMTLEPEPATSVYDRWGITGTSAAATVTGFNNNSVADWTLANVFVGNPELNIFIELFHPSTFSQKVGFLRSVRKTDSAGATLTAADAWLLYSAANARSGFEFHPSSGNISGTVRVYEMGGTF